MRGLSKRMRDENIKTFGSLSSLHSYHFHFTTLLHSILFLVHPIVPSHSMPSFNLLALVAVTSASLVSIQLHPHPQPKLQYLPSPHLGMDQVLLREAFDVKP